MGAIAGQIATAGVQAGLNILSDAIASKRQLKHNKSLAAYQFGQNRQLLQEQLAYNTPKAQMERYKDAGLNPNMVLSQGSAGNQSAPLSYPDIKPADVGYGAQLGSVLMDQFLKVRQGELLKTQTDLNNVKKDEVTINKDLKRAQTEVVKANPYLNKSYVDAMVTQLQSTALMKKQEADFLLQETSADQKNRFFYEQEGGAYNVERGWIKLSNQLRLLDQKFELGEKDQQAKAQIIQSKEFQNELQKIQVDWMTNAEITPQHIYQGIMLLLGKLIGK